MLDGIFSVFADATNPDAPPRSDDAILLGAAKLGEWFDVITTVDVKVGGDEGETVSADSIDAVLTDRG